MSGSDAFPSAALDVAGLNRQHVFALADLPEAQRIALAAPAWARQLILIGHAGRRLWDGVQTSGLGGEHPIDTYTTQTVDRVFSPILAGRPYRIIYPDDGLPVGLQALGQLAGWHHESPLRVGVDAEWGSWFAYRAVLLADSDFPVSIAVDRGNPCKTCASRDCIATCPAGATGETFHFERCMAERLRTDSPCALGCLARQACPVGAIHRYDAAQIRHSYGQSLAMLQRWAADGR